MNVSSDEEFATGETSIDKKILNYLPKDVQLKRDKEHNYIIK